MQRLPIRLLVSDVDGTLTNSAHEVVRRNIEAIERFRARGGLFTLATGRGPETAGRYAELVALDLPAILYNGALIYDFIHDQVIWQTKLPPAQALLAAEVATTIPGVFTLVYRAGHIYAYRLPAWGRQWLYDDFALMIPVDDLAEAFAEVPHKLIIVGDDNGAAFPAFRAAYTAALVEAGLETPHLVQSAPFFLEIVPAGHNKATAMKRLAAEWGIDLRHIAAIGDHHNDLEMIQAAGLGAAPLSGTPEVRGVADRVVAHCDDGAVADLIDRWVLSA